MLFSLPQSNAALDRWQDRVVLICGYQSVGAFWYMASAYVFLPIADTRLRNSHKDSAPPRWKLPLVILTLLLPRASRVANLKNLRLQGISENPIDPLCLAPIQLLQTIICIFLLAYNFVEYSVRSPMPWFSFVLCFLPSTIGFVYSLLGIARFYINSSSRRLIACHVIVTNQYFDDSLEVGPLEQAYQAQQEPVLEDIMSQEIDESLSNGQEGDHIRMQPVQSRNRQPAIVRNREPQGHAAAADIVPANQRNFHRDDQIRTPALPNPVRFRWQEQVAARSGGTSVWAPIMLVQSLSLIRLYWYRFELQAFRLGHVYLSREFLIIHILEAPLPAILSFSTSIGISWSLKQPRFWIIFTSFCLSWLTIVTWAVDCIYLLWSFFRFVSIIWASQSIATLCLAGVAVIMGTCHYLMTLIITNIEWSPGYSSLSIEFERIKRERQWDQAEPTNG